MIGSIVNASAVAGSDVIALRTAPVVSSGNQHVRDSGNTAGTVSQIYPIAPNINRVVKPWKKRLTEQVGFFEVI